MRALWLVLAWLAAVNGFSCKDQNNNDVDWFAVYKMPKLDDNSLAGIGDGHAFYYMDVNNKKMTASSVPLNQNNQAVAYTLQQYYDVQKQENVFHAMYNDEEVETELAAANRNDTFLKAMRESVKTLFGHTKGVVFFNEQTGIWLIHSVPKFPSPTAYSYPDSGTIYGQSMLCITFNYNQLSKIGTLLYYNHPNIYSSALPTGMAAANPDLQKVIAGGFQSGSPAYYVIDLISKGGHHFMAYAKSAKYGKDWYDGLVAQGLKTGLEVETWRRGSEVPLNCESAYPVIDSQDMKVGGTTKFKYTKDHSKLAVSTSKLRPYICIGDINRMTTQYTRGGGTVCLSDSFVWEAYHKLTVDVNSC